MGKKTIIFMLLLFILSNIHVYSQELQWREKNELTKSLYLSLENLGNEKSHCNRKNKKSFTVQEQIKQQETKNFLETHFIFHDTVPELVFFNKDQIIEWGKERVPFASLYYSSEFCITGCNIYITVVAGCSGIPCWNINIFKEKEGLWKLITGTSSRLREVITVKIDDNEEEIAFRTTSGKVIGRLPFSIIIDD